MPSATKVNIKMKYKESVVALCLITILNEAKKNQNLEPPNQAKKRLTLEVE